MVVFELDRPMYARNPRKNDHATGAMCAAIREFGFRIPVVAKSDGTVVDGHLRGSMTREAALLLFNSVHVTVSAICRISFMCAQTRIEME